MEFGDFKWSLGFGIALKRAFGELRFNISSIIYQYFLGIHIIFISVLVYVLSKDGTSNYYTMFGKAKGKNGRIKN